MPVLSPVAATILASIQTAGKNDGKVEGDAFLTLLETGGGDFSAGLESEQSLVDSLYETRELADPVAAPTQASEPIKTKTPASNDSGRASDDSDKNPVQDTVRSKREPSDVPSLSKDRLVYKVASSEKKQPVSENARVADVPVVARTAYSQETAISADEIARRIRDKIEDLSDLLASVAALLGVSGATQLATVKVTQVSLTITQQELQVNQPSVDLSDRFQQLIAALSSGQYLPSDAEEKLNKVFASFQALFANVVNGNASASGVDIATGCAACQTSIHLAVETITQTKSDRVDLALLGDKLGQIGKWLSEFQPLAESKSATNNNVAYDDGGMVFSDKSMIVSAPPSVLLVPQSTIPTDKASNASLVQALVDQADGGINPVASTSSVTPQSIAPIVTTATAAPSVSVVANTLAGSVEGGADFSSGHNGSGQGGSGTQNAAIGSAAGVNATGNTSQVGTLQFSKVLKEVAQAPVAEQVVFNIKTAVKNGDSKIEIQLEPLELGKLHIKLDLSSDGKASGIVVTAENKATLDLLQRDARGLQNALADAGIKTDSGSLSFNLRGGDRDQQEARQQTPSYISPLPEEDVLAPLTVVSRSYVVNINDGLDIKI